MEVWQLNDSQVAALIRSANGQVEMWTSHRLPFEPKGVLLKARNHLRIQLSKLAANSQQLLEARYLSVIEAFVDTENVLIYNVGTSAFASASRYGLRFIREFAEPPRAPNDLSVWRHYNCYALVPRRSVQHPGTRSARFRFELPMPSTSLKAHDYWWAARQSLNCINDAFDTLSGPYRMTLEFTGPLFRTNRASLVKPLFDGVISAFHYDPDINPTNPAIDRIAARLKVSPVQVVDSLQTSLHAIFGKRKLVRPTKTFVAWNPADERCLVGELLIRHGDSSTKTIDVTVSPLDR